MLVQLYSAKIGNFYAGYAGILILTGVVFSYRFLHGEERLFLYFRSLFTPVAAGFGYPLKHGLKNPYQSLR